MPPFENHYFLITKINRYIPQAPADIINNQLIHSAPPNNPTLNATIKQSINHINSVTRYTYRLLTHKNCSIATASKIIPSKNSTFTTSFAT